MRLLSLATESLLWASALLPSDDASVKGGLLSRKLKHHISDARERWHVSGASVVVVTSPTYNSAQTGKHVWRTEVLPLGDANAKGDSVTEDTLFGIASNSKLFTALAIGLLVDRGTTLENGAVLDWDTKIKDILPEWTLADEYASDHADLIDLGAMRSGLPSHDFAHRSQPVLDMVANLRNLQPTAEIRQHYQYNNEHYFTLAAIVERLTKQPLHDFVQENIFNKLSMSASTYNATLARATGRLTDGFSHTGQNITLCKEKSKGAKHQQKSCHGKVESIGWWAEGDGLENAGAGGVITSATDIAKWLRELLDPQVIPAHLIAKCATPVINSGNTNIPGITRAFYGLGQQISSYRGREVVSHTGGVPGQTSLVVRIPSEGIAIAVLTNDGTLSGPSFFYATAMSIFDHLLDGGDTLAHWEDAMFKVAFAGSPTPLPEEPSAPPSGFDGIPGIYEGPGYGEFSLTRLERRGDDDAFYDTIFKTLQTSGVNATGPLFVAPYERTFVSHIVLTPFDDQHFNWTVTKLFKPDDKFVPGHLVSGPAVVTDDGIGFFGGFNSQGAGVKLNTPAVEDVEKRATVWFERR